MEAISALGDFEAFVSDDIQRFDDDNPPWTVPCGSNLYQTCVDCPKCRKDGEGKWTCDDKYRIMI